jgi:hypothetical protein
MVNPDRLVLGDADFIVRQITARVFRPEIIRGLPGPHARIAIADGAVYAVGFLIVMLAAITLIFILCEVL